MHHPYAITSYEVFDLGTRIKQDYECCFHCSLGLKINIHTFNIYRPQKHLLLD